MNPNEQQAFMQQEHSMRAMQSNLEASQLNQLNNQMFMEQQERNMLKEQLDLSEELERIHHLLKGEVLKKDKNGIQKWTDPEDNDMVILSEYGIHLVLNTITWYINKNTLLSNYSDEVILKKMEDFATELTDTVFMEYEKVFQHPSDQDCIDELNKRIDSKVTLRKYALELAGKQANEVEIKERTIQEIENRIQEEIDKIRQQKMKNKLKRFMLLIRVIQDAVHSTYLRAYQGQERKTLREHIHISETKGLSPPPQGNQGGLFSWFRRN
jgi:hypothetical protein